MDGGLTIVHRKNEGGIYLVDEKVIKVVDDIMGSGKSTWAINYINNNQEKKFLCVVPLLEECERFKEQTEIDIVDPKNWGSKWNNFKWLVENEKNIVTTHALIQKMDLDMLELLKSKDYVLMIDECLDVLSPYKISKDDVKIIFNENLVSLDDDGFLIWNEEKDPYDGVYNKENKNSANEISLPYLPSGDEIIYINIVKEITINVFTVTEATNPLWYLEEQTLSVSNFRKVTTLVGGEGQNIVFDKNLAAKYGYEIEGYYESDDTNNISYDKINNLSIFPYVEDGILTEINVFIRYIKNN